MKIYFSRHGESVVNLSGEFSNQLGKHGLSVKGEAQSEALAQRFDPCAKWKLYSSPILRAQETAAVLAKHLDCEIETTDALREYDVGVLEGRSDEEAWKIYWGVVESWIERQDYDKRIEGGESFNDIRARFLPFVRLLTEREEENVICVSHGGTLNLMLPLVLANISRLFPMQNRLDNTAIVEVEARLGELVAISWARCELPPYPAEL